MQRSILIVDEDDTRRRAIAGSLAARGQRYLDVADAFAAMAALGRADFGAVLAAEGRRTLSLRGLCQLARKRHPDIMLLVLPKPGSDVEEIRRVLELTVEMIDPELSVERLVTAMIERVDAETIDLEPTQTGLDMVRHQDASIPSFNPFDAPTGSDPLSGAFDSVPRVDIPMLAAAHGEAPPVRTAPAALDLPELVLDKTEKTRPDARLPPRGSAPQSAPSTTQEAEIHLDGHFEDVDGGAGAALLMGLFAQDMTGRLVVGEGEAEGTLYLYRGEPVWADDPAGDAGLYRKLVQKSFLKPDVVVDAVAEGQLLGSLMQRGLLSGAQMHDFMREVVRDRVIGLAVQSEGTYQFNEDKAFLDTAPLLKVNPFGLILDSRRRRLPPPALMALGGEIESKYLQPQPALQAASEKLRPFVRGAKASDVIDGATTVKDFWEKVGLDPFMGTLVVVVMRDARLVTLEELPQARGLDLAETAFTRETSVEIAIADSDQEHPTAATSEAEEKAREDIFTLYMRLKPLSQPRQVLGVALAADGAAVDAAYEQRMAELDPRRIPEGSAQHLLAQRIDELRRKVTSAYQTLKLQMGSASDGGTNPF
ncbi:MAG: hypothetical protein Q8O67_03010 [Deltaproteobacteria bacterium]|nr:hypothetical protein [Deltaproteobacteria bacterium]